MKKRLRQIRSKKPAIRKETAAGTVVFFVENGLIKVLLLERPDGKIEIGPKGHVKPGENLLRTAHREMIEEIGVPLHMDTNFMETTKYKLTDEDSKTHKHTVIDKTLVYFLAFLNKHERKELRVSSEHANFYFLPIDEAMEKTTRKEWKKVLAKAKEYITQNYLT